MESAVGDRAEFTRHRRAQRGHHRWTRGRRASGDQSLNADTDRKEDQKPCIPGFVVVFRIDDNPDADARSCLRDFECPYLDVGLPGERLADYYVTDSAEQGGSGQEQDIPTRRKHAPTLGTARQRGVRDASGERQRLPSGRRRSVNVDRRPLFDVAIQPLQVVIAQPDAAMCRREPNAITFGPSV